MSFTPTGWNAIFNPNRTDPVVGWDEYGHPLIVNAKTGKRISVHDLEDHDFCNLEPADTPFVGVLPADGWSIGWSDGTTDRVMGFAVQADGRTLPILIEPSGHGSPYYADGSEPGARLIPPRS